MVRSWFQEVPDHQEVFRYTQSNTLIIIEVLRKVEPEDGNEPIRIIFDSMLVVNTTSTVDTTPEFPTDHIKRQDAVILTGTQYIAKNDQPPDQLDQVRVALCLFNTVDQHNDLVVSFTVPIKSTRSSDGRPDERVGWDRAKMDFIELVESLTIKPGLFKAPSDL